MARACARRQARPRQYENPGLSDSRGHQSEAAGGRCSCAIGAVDGLPEPDTGVTALKNEMAMPFGESTNSSWLSAGRGKLLQRPHDAPLPGSFWKELGRALGKPNAGIRGDQPDTLQPAFLEMLEERAPTRLILLRPFADAENLPIAALAHADCNQQRDIAHLAGPTAFEHEAVEIQALASGGAYSI
jgi:hypothetical protein